MLYRKRAGVARHAVARSERAMDNRAGTNREAVYAYIRRHMALYGAPPTVREIGRACGISSTSVVMHHLNRLRRDGCIEPRPARRRGQATARNVRLPDARTVFVGQEVVMCADDGTLVTGAFVEVIGRA